MNSSFFGLPEERQNNILNAAYRVFSENSYRRAPMSEIAAEGNISKSLLFYYFRNKLELYCFLWDRAAELTAESVKENRVYETDDFFEMLRRSLRAKCALMRKYPYLSGFTMNAYYEKDPGAAGEISKRFSAAEEMTVRRLEEKIDTAVFREDMTFEDIYREITLASEGMLIRMYRSGSISADAFEAEYLSMTEHWEKAYGRKSNDR